MFDKMKQLMDLKKQADKIKKELDSSTIEINEVEGIRLIVNGAQNFKYLEIDSSLLNSENKGKIEVDLLKSINAAIDKSQKVAAQKMSAVMPGLPGM